MISRAAPATTKLAIPSKQLGWRLPCTGADERRVLPPSAGKLRALAIFGTRPEAIKLAPVVRALDADRDHFETRTLCSGQHQDLLLPFRGLLGLRVDADLGVMQPNQTPSGLAARILDLLDPFLTREAPDLVLVQGDTTTAMAAALAAFHGGIPVGHVEAGLRSGDPRSPFPEEMNRRLITRLATLHFAATEGNRRALLDEGVVPEDVFVTGNPGIDALQTFLERATPSPQVAGLLEAAHGLRTIVLTTHRRESLGPIMIENLRVLRRAVDARSDLALFFPVHPNPSVREAAAAVLTGHPRIQLLEPLGHVDFLRLLASAFLIVSDSGGVQEEAPTLGKPLLVLRENTERPEALACGIARLVGGRPESLAAMIDEALAPGSWAERVTAIENPFGRGDAGARIAAAILAAFGRSEAIPHAAASAAG